MGFLYPQTLHLKHHFTASGMVLCQKHILLVNHKRIGAWVPPGGHIEDDEMPVDTVKREISEETGLQVKILSAPRPLSTDTDAFFLEQPLYIQSVKAVEQGMTFYHIDLAFLCKPLTDPVVPGSLPELKCNRQEVKEARWVRLTDLPGLNLAKNVMAAVELAKNAIKHPVS